MLFKTHPPSRLSPRQSVDSTNASSAEQTQSVPSAVEEDGKDTPEHASVNVSEVRGRVQSPLVHAPNPVMSAYRLYPTTAPLRRFDTYAHKYHVLSFLCTVRSVTYPTTHHISLTPLLSFVPCSPHCFFCLVRTRQRRLLLPLLLLLLLLPPKLPHARGSHHRRFQPYWKMVPKQRALISCVRSGHG